MFSVLYDLLLRKMMLFCYIRWEELAVWPKIRAVARKIKYCMINEGYIR